jgi:hypothetical protein
VLTLVSRSTLGQVLSIDYLIEKAVESAVNKALTKVDEFVDKATKKVDEIAANAFDEAFARFSGRVNVLQASTQNVDEVVQNAYDQAFAKLSERVDEVQSSTQNVDEVVDRAIEKACNQAFAKFSEQVKEVQSSTQNVNEVTRKTFDKAFAELSKRFSELESYITTQQIQQMETAVHTAINGLEESGQQPMEIEEMGDISAADTEEVDSDHEYCSTDYSKAIWEYPRPGSTYAIHMHKGHESMLIVNKFSKRFNQLGVNGTIPKFESQHCYWQCTGGSSDCLYFINKGTKKYMGVNPEELHKKNPGLDSKINSNGENTRFYLQRADNDSYLLQARVGKRLLYVAIDYRTGYLYPPRLLCRDQMEEPLTRWKFRRIEGG